MRGGAGGGGGPHQWLHARLRAYIDWLLAHPRLVVAAMAALTAFWASQLPALRVEIDPDANLPQDHAYIRALHILESTFGEKNLLVIGLFPKNRNVFTPLFLAKVERITERIRALPGLVRASYLGIATPLAKAIEGAGDTLLVRPLLDATPKTDADAAEVRRRAYLNPFYSGTVVSSDGSATSISANFRLTPAMPGYPEIQARVAGVIAEEDDGTFVVQFGGPIAILAAMAAVTERTVWLFPLAVLVIALIHYEAFRTLQGMILPLVTALLAVVWALGLMGFLRIPLDPFNTTTPILVLAVAAGHAVQILKRYYEEYEHQRDQVRAVRIAMLKLTPVMITAGTVAALSFFSLAIFATATIRNFGLLTGFGILSAIVIELTVIPAVRILLPPPRDREVTREAASGRALEMLLGRVSRGVARGPVKVVVVSLLIMVVAVVGGTQLHVDTSLKRQFGAADPVQIADNALSEAFSGTNTLAFLIEGPGDGSLDDPQALAAIAALQRFVEADPHVGKTTSIADVVVELNMALNGGMPSARTLPTSAALISQYLFLYSLSGDPDDLNHHIDPAHRIAVLRAFMREDSTEYSQHFIRRVRGFVTTHFPPGFRVQYSGTNASNAALTQVMVRGKLLNMLQIAAIIVLVAGVMLGSVAGGLLVAAPLLMAVLVNLGAMGFARVPLDIVTSPIAAMAVGIGADYAIYFIFRFREELAVNGTPALALASALRTSGKAIVYVSSAIAGGYLVLCASGFVYHTELGVMVALSMVVSSAAAISFLPALLLIARPKFLFGNGIPKVA